MKQPKVVVTGTLLVAARYLTWTNVFLLAVALLIAVRFIYRDSYMSGVDAIQLNADPNLVTSPFGIMELNGIPSHDHVVKVFNDRIAKPYRRFRQRAVRSPFLWPYWQDDPDFDVRNHVIQHTLTQHDDSCGFDYSKYCETSKGGKGSKGKYFTRDTVHRFIEERLAGPMDINKPLWEMHYFSPFALSSNTTEEEEKKDSNEEVELGSAIVVRFHHCMSDGVNALKLVCQLDQTLVRKGAQKSASEEKQAKEERSGDKTKVEKKKKKKSAARTMPSVWTLAATALPSVFKLLGLSQDDECAVHSRVPFDTLQHRVSTAWSTRPIDFVKVRAISKKHKVSVNTVLVGAVNYAIRAYTQEQHAGARDTIDEDDTKRSSSKAIVRGVHTENDRIDGYRHAPKNGDERKSMLAGVWKRGPKTLAEVVPSLLTAVVWVSLIPLNLFKPVKFGNFISGVYFRLSLAAAPDQDEQSQFAEILADMQKQGAGILSSAEPLIGNLLLRIFGWLPAKLVMPLWYLLAFKSSVSISSVPGPRDELRFGATGDGGADDKKSVPVRSMTFFCPPCRSIGMFVTVMTYNGSVRCAFSADKRVVPYCERMVDKFHEVIQNEKV